MNPQGTDDFRVGSDLHVTPQGLDLTSIRVHRPEVSRTRGGQLIGVHRRRALGEPLPSGVVATLPSSHPSVTVARSSSRSPWRVPLSERQPTDAVNGDFAVRSGALTPGWHRLRMSAAKLSSSKNKHDVDFTSPMGGR